jgi:hypothetical protein
VEKQTWWSRRAIGLHAVIIVIVPTFAGLCVWQTRRALAGNDLSWAYVFEWPFFAGYAIYMWWRFLHEVPTTDSDVPSTGPAGAAVAAGAARSARKSGRAVAPGAEQAPDLEADRAAYNEYLSALATRGKRKQWR